MKRTALITLEYPPIVGGVANYYANIVSAVGEDLIVIDNASGLFVPWWRSIKRLMRILKQKNIEHVLVGQILPLGTAAAIISKMKDMPYTVFVHGMDITVPQKYWRKRVLLRWILRNAEAVITISDYTEKKIRELVPDASLQITQIPPGAHVTPEMLPQETHSQLTDKKPYILSVGRLVKRKGFDNSIKAFAEIADSYPDLQYIITGKGAYKSELEKIIIEYHLQQRVHIVESMADAELADAYSNCEFHVMPARTIGGVDFEGFGITVLEAGLFGKPTIGGLDSGMTSSIIDKETGLLVDGASISEISMALQHLLADSNYAAQLGGAAKQFVEAEHIWLAKGKALRELISD